MKAIRSSWGALALVVSASIASGCGGDSPPGTPDPTRGGAPSTQHPPAGGAAQAPGGALPGNAPSQSAPSQTSPASVPSQGGSSVQNPASRAVALVVGTVTDSGAGLSSLGLAGAGTLADATGVRVSTLLPGGALKLVSEVVVDAKGSFSVAVPLNVDVHGLFSLCVPHGSKWR